MKKIKFLLYLCLVTGMFIACSDDDSSTDEQQEEETELTQAELILGTWQVTGETDIDGSDVELTECDLLDTAVFTEESLVANSYENLSNEDEPVSCSEEPIVTTSTWSIPSENFLQVERSGNTFEATILELTETTFTIEYVASEELNADGTVTEETATITYTKA